MENKPMNNSLLNKDFSVFSKYRSEFMGLATLTIIILHYCAEYNQTDAQAFRLITWFFGSFMGSVGVEFFVFFSGMGLYYSMSKNADAITFYKKRMSRVLLPYAIWGCLYFFVQDIILLNKGLLRFAYDFSLVSFFAERELRFWFIAFIIPMYLVFPVIFKLISSKNGTGWFVLLTMCAVAFAVTLKLFFPQAYKNTDIAIMRIPIFIIGAYCGRLSQEKKKLHIGYYLLGLFCMAVKIASTIPSIDKKLPSFVTRYIACLFAIALLIIIVLLFDTFKLTHVKKFFILVGQYSLELYMTHVALIQLYRIVGIPVASLPAYIVLIAASVVFSIGLHWITRFILDKSKSA